MLQRRFVFGAGVDEPIVWYEGSGTTDRRYLIANEQGSIIAVSGSTDTINSYDEYGQPASSNVGRFQFTGQMWIPEASLYNFRAREYSAALGRFLQTDPVLQDGGLNIYAYVSNDPINFTDMIGLGNDLQPPRGWQGWDDPPPEEITITGWKVEETDINPFGILVVFGGDVCVDGVGSGCNVDVAVTGTRHRRENSHERATRIVMEQMFWVCMNDEAGASGVVGTVLAGGAAVASGSPIFPKSLAELFGVQSGGRVGIAGGGPSGGSTSVVSAMFRGFFGNATTNSNWLTRLTGTRSLGGQLGRIASAGSRVAGAALIGAGIGEAAGAAYLCRGWLGG